MLGGVSLLSVFIIFFLLLVPFILHFLFIMIFVNLFQLLAKFHLTGSDDQQYLLSDDSVTQNSLPPRSLSQLHTAICRLSAFLHLIALL